MKKRRAYARFFFGGGGFTLIELVIVVLIIGILSMTLVPRLTGYLARVRDFKRQSDLRDIAMAIDKYKNTHSNLPWHNEDRARPLSELYHYFLSGGFLSSKPRDPLKINKVKMYACYHSQNPLCRSWVLEKGDYAEWQYFYKVTHKDQQNYDVALLVAKVETPDFANYVVGTTPNGDLFGNVWWDRLSLDPKQWLSSYHICSTLEKVKPWEEQWGPNCKYSSNDHLYYMLKLE